MLYALNPKHLSNVLRLSAPQRYDYFIKRIADWGRVWGLRSPSGWETVADNSGREMLPLWPHRKFAELCAVERWSTSVPSPIETEDLLNGWLPDLIATGRLIAVFPLPTGQGIPVKPERVKEDLLEEQSRFMTED